MVKGSKSPSGKIAASPRMSTRAFAVGAVIAALLIACVVSMWASHLPDGLTYVADRSGMAEAEEASVTSGSPLARYDVTFVDNPWASLAIAGAIGCAFTFGLAWIVGRVAKRHRIER